MKVGIYNIASRRIS